MALSQALVLGAEIVSTFDNAVQLGECKLIEEIMIGEDKVLRFSGVKRGDACTIVLRGKSKETSPCRRVNSARDVHAHQ